MKIRKLSSTKRLLAPRYKYIPNPSDVMLSESAQKAKLSLESKILNGVYQFENRPCFCGSNDAVIISERDRYGLYYPFVICKNCGIMRANPRMNSESYIEFYGKEYRDLYGEGDCDKDALFTSRLENANKIYKYVTKVSHLSSGVVFDIGCNMGTMLVPFHKNGFEVYGVDYGSENIEAGMRITGIHNLIVGGTRELLRLGKKADLVILNHVLEHFLDLGKELRDIHKIMNPGALVYVALPGTFWAIKHTYKGNIMGVLQNAHTYQFSLTLLIYVMECSGFELVAGNEEVVAIFKKTTKFRNRGDIPAGQFKKTLRYLKFMEIKAVPKFYALRFLDFIGARAIVKKFIPQRLWNFMARL